MTPRDPRLFHTDGPRRQFPASRHRVTPLPGARLNGGDSGILLLRLDARSRRMHTSRSAYLLLTIAVLSLCQRGIADSDLEEIVNYRQYSADLSSSGQPSKSQLRAVRTAGFERIVFLAFSDHDESIGNEDRIVRDLGMEYVHIPVDWESPAPSDFRTFAGAMQSAPNNSTG